MTPSTRSRTPPACNRRGPDSAVPSIPPTVVPGTTSSTASRCRAPASRSPSAASGTPAWAMTTRSPAACSTMRSSRRVSTTRSSRRGGVPQPSLVPSPRATSARPSAAAARSTAAASSVDPGAATKRAGTPSTASPSPAGSACPPVACRSASSTPAGPVIRTAPPGRPRPAGGRRGAGPGTSPHSRGVGNTLPGLDSPAGSNAHRTSCMVSRSSAVNIRGMCLALSEPTPCSPVIEPPCSRQRSRIAPETSSARSASPATEPSKSTSGCRLPSPAWKTLATRTPESPERSAIARSTSGSAVRGITPSWTM